MAGGAWARGSRLRLAGAARRLALAAAHLEAGSALRALAELARAEAELAGELEWLGALARAGADRRALILTARDRLELALEDIAAARRWSLADGQLAAYHAQLAIQRVGEAAEALREAEGGGGARRGGGGLSGGTDASSARSSWFTELPSAEPKAALSPTSPSR